LMPTSAIRVLPFLAFCCVSRRFHGTGFSSVRGFRQDPLAATGVG
jgi:hypothetical protein